MKIDFSQPILNLDGRPTVFLNENEEREDFTLRKACVNALLLNERELSGDERLKRFKLAERIHQAGELVDLTVEEASLIKSLSAKAHATLVYGRVAEALEGKLVEPSEV